MKFRSKASEAAVITLGCVLVDVGCGVGFRIVEGHWPSLGFWLSGVVVYVAVVLPAIRRARRKVGDSRQG